MIMLSRQHQFVDGMWRADGRGTGSLPGIVCNKVDQFYAYDFLYVSNLCYFITRIGNERYIS